MTWILLGCVLLLGFLLGGTGMRRLGRLAGRNWRPGVSMLALAVYVGSAFLAMRGQGPVAALLGGLGLILTLGARRAAPAAARRPRPEPDMGVEAASAILGVAPDASDDEVQAAYLRLIRRTHPDQGGTSGLAAQLNAARDAMLKRGRPASGP